MLTCSPQEKIIVFECSFSLALNGGGRFLSPSSPLSSLLCSLVSWETLSALLSKLKYYGLTGLLMQLTLLKLGFPFMGTRTASPRGRYGERPQRDSVWKYICKNTTCWPATAHDVTTGVPQYKCRRENTSSAFSSSLTGLFEACIW